MREYLKNLAIHYKGDYHKISKALKAQTQIPSYPISYPYITLYDSLYPECFKELEQPPYVIFYMGNPNLLSKPKVSVVGSRISDTYSLLCTEKLVHQLKKKYVIVSGLAKGIDAAAHSEALDFYTIGVLGCGIDEVYPKSNGALFDVMKSHQCIISEYPPGVKPQRHAFPFRNRLIAALGERLYVMSAGLKSGTMTSVNEALKLNRHVICLPHPIFSEVGKGCNQLIQEGADILLSFDNPI